MSEATREIMNFIAIGFIGFMALGITAMIIAASYYGKKESK